MKERGAAFEVEPRVGPTRLRELDREGAWPHEAYQALAKAGWLGLLYPERYGGLDGSYKDLVVLLETL